jgi:hypothetical protein
MDLIVIAAVGMCIGVLLVAMGLSFIDFGLGSLGIADSYTTTAREYYQNPLHTFNSKYFHYQPKGSVIVTKKQWADIEKNIGIQIHKSQKAGWIIGYKEAIVDVRLKVREEKDKVSPSSPYATLGVESTAPIKEIEDRYKHLLHVYKSVNFSHLDRAFVSLAELRTEQLEKAWRTVNTGIGNKGQY